MSSHSLRLEKHLKNHAKRIRKSIALSHSAALEQASIEYGFSGWKQARSHMSWADNQIKLTLLTLSNRTADLAMKLHRQKGYPYAQDELTGQRYIPSDWQQCEAVASRILLLGLFEELHAPTSLCHSETAKLWFRGPLPSATILVRQQSLYWKISSQTQRLVSSQSNEGAEPGRLTKPTPDDVRSTLLEFLHATFTISVNHAASGGIEEVLNHPGFKEYVGFALAAAREMNWPMQGIDSLLDHAGISHWTHVGAAPSGTKSFVWLGRHFSVRSQTPFEAAVPKISGPIALPRTSLTSEQHAKLADLLVNLDVPSAGHAQISRQLSLIKEMLASWASQAADQQADLYYQPKRSMRKIRFLAPAQEKAIRPQTSKIRTILEDQAENCPPRKLALKHLGQLEKQLNHWLSKTQNDWKKTNQKLVMDSIGLVAAEPKWDLLDDGEALWQPVEIMDTLREENLIDSLRPHLYKVWQEEDELESWPFDASDPDTENSLNEHLQNLAFYRYIGGATTQRQFLADVHKGFYFEPMHIWFKQKLIG